MHASCTQDETGKLLEAVVRRLCHLMSKIVKLVVTAVGELQHSPDQEDLNAPIRDGKLVTDLVGVACCGTQFWER